MQIAVCIRGLQGVVLTRDQDGRPTGEAFVEVPSEAAQQAALTLHRARMGPRYIEIFVASKPDMQQVGSVPWPQQSACSDEQLWHAACRPSLSC